MRNSQKQNQPTPEQLLAHFYSFSKSVNLIPEPIDEPEQKGLSDEVHEALKRLQDVGFDSFAFDLKVMMRTFVASKEFTHLEEMERDNRLHRVFEVIEILGTFEKSLGNFGKIGGYNE